MYSTLTAVTVCVRTVGVYGQERELLMLPAPLVRSSAPDHNMCKQLWDSRLRVDDEAEQSIDFECCKWEFPITAKVCDVRPVSNI